MKKIIGILLFTLIVTACDFSINTNSEKEKGTGLGKMPNVEKLTFNNIYVANEKICNIKKIPITRFAIEYPDSLDVSFPNNERDHINIKKWRNNFISEELSIGNSTVTYNTKSTASSLLEGLTEEFKKQLPSMEINFIGKKNFKGEMVYLFQGTVNFSAYQDQGYNGNYKIMGLMPLPKKNKDMNAIMVTFIANENSPISSFSDFETLGMIGTVWETFRYIE